jgi:hypothetical protein
MGFNPCGIQAKAPQPLMIHAQKLTLFFGNQVS